MLYLGIMVCANALSAPATPSPLGADLKAIQGKWQAVAIEEKGFAWSKDEVAGVSAEIANDVLIYKEAGQTERFRIAIDSTQKPAHIDLRLIAEGVDPTKACHCIYVIDGDRLKICLSTEFKADDAADRPTEFATGDKRPPKGRLLITMERAKK